MGFDKRAEEAEGDKSFWGMCRISNALKCT